MPNGRARLSRITFLTLATVVPIVLFGVGLIVHNTRLERSALERGMRDTARALVLALDRDINDVLPALALTAYARREDRDRVLAAGFDHGIAKPVEPADLVREVARLAGR